MRREYDEILKASQNSRIIEVGKSARTIIHRQVQEKQYDQEKLNIQIKYEIVSTCNNEPHSVERRPICGDVIKTDIREGIL